MRQIVLLVCCGCVVSMAMTHQAARAGNTYWDVTDGSWTVGTNWTAGAPTAGDQAIINNGGIARLVYSGACSYLYLGYGAGTDQLAIYNAGSLDTNYITLGLNGVGKITHQAGLVDVNYRVWVGYGDQGIYNMSGTAQLNSGDHIMVGTNGGSSGELNILSGATASSDRGFIAYNSASTGTVLVDGAGSSWSTTNAMYVAGSDTTAGGTGTLTIDHGGLVDVSTMLKIWDAGTANVTDGTLNASSLNMVGGAKLNTYSTSVVDLGAVDMRGVGTTWTHATSLQVDAAGDASAVTLDEGASLSSNGAYIGYLAGSNGSVTVNGYDTQWDAGSHLYVGRAGTGTLTIASTEDWFGPGPTEVTCGYLYLGRYAGSTGTVTVGDPSVFNEDAYLLVQNSIEIGYGGTGQLNIQDAGYVGVQGTTYIRGGGTLDLEGILATNELALSAGGTFGIKTGKLRVNGITGFGNTIDWADLSVELSWNGGPAAHTVGAGQTMAVQNLWLKHAADMRVEGGGDLTIDWMFELNNNSTLTVDGAGSTVEGGASVTSTSSLSTLNVTNGGKLTSHTNLGLSGAATISGTGSAIIGDADVSVSIASTPVTVNSGGTIQWGPTHRLAITGQVDATDANFSGNRIEVLSGGTFNVTHLTDFNVSQVTVDGNGSLWHHSSTVVIGSGPTAEASSMIVSDGGVVDSAYGYVGLANGASGSAIVQDEGSLWDVNTWMVVGYYGTGVLTINNGADAECGHLYVGKESTGVGTLISGDAALAPTLINSTYGVDIGVTGTGTLVLNASGAMHTPSTFSVGANGTLDMQGGTVQAGTIAFDPGATPLPLAAAGRFAFNQLTGLGDAVNLPDIDMTLGVSGTTAAHTIGASQSMYCRSFDVGGQAPAVLTVGGLASYLNAATEVRVGQSYAAELMIDEYGHVKTAGTATIGPNGTLRMRGVPGPGNWSYLDCDRFEVAPGSTLDLTTGAVIRTNQLAGFGNNIDIGGTLLFGMDVGVTAADMVVGAGQTLNVGWQVTVGYSRSASLTIRDGGDVFAEYTSGPLGSLPGVVGTVLVTGNGSQWNIDGALAVGNSQGQGVMMIADGGIVTASSGSVGTGSGQGSLTIQDPNSSLTIKYYNLTVGSAAGSGTGAVDVNGGSLNVDDSLVVQTTGTVNLQGGSITTDTVDDTHGGVFNFDSGHLAVSSYMGQLVVDGGGWLHPGQSVGTTTVSNAMQMHYGSTLVVEISGANSSDFIDVTGAAAINTKLIVDLLGGFFPLYGNQWLIMQASGGIAATVQAPIGYAVSLSGDTTKLYLTRTAPNLLGDANNDGVVSADDFAAVQAHFGNTGTSDGSLLGDANDDGVVSADDFASIQTHFGDVAPYSVEADPIPEPATIVLLALSGVAMMRRRRHPIHCRSCRA